MVIGTEAPIRMDRVARIPNYEKEPVVVAGPSGGCVVGWDAIASRVGATGARVIVVEAYPGVRREDLEEIAERLRPEKAVFAGEAFKSVREIDKMVAADLTDDPVFGMITGLELVDFFDIAVLSQLREYISRARGQVIVYGAGASLVVSGDLLVYADLARWEIQQRQRSFQEGNLGAQNEDQDAFLKYKRGFFVDWRVADRHKVSLMDRIDYLLDTSDQDRPKMVEAKAAWNALDKAVTGPFRVVPFFDPAPWGGQWMKTVCDLDPGPVNYGWCFDCVPEENSLLLGFGTERFEMPSINLIFRNPRQLLGGPVFERFGREFPIRFDFLDTMDGGNLSLQVHPLTGYIREQFGMTYTQDESYYLLDAGQDATVYLGLKRGTDQSSMAEDLRRAQVGQFHFPDEKYVNRFPARRHDHFLIPAGTVHCAGANCLVLEISATPYIFTFKLWDWDRLGLNGRPRPVHVDHGMRSIQWHRETEYATTQLINQISPISSGEGWRREKTGLHEAEFIETHRDWFIGKTPHEPELGVNVLNLVQGEEAVIESLDGGFDPFVVHFAETFIVPQDAGPYTITPHGIAKGTECATVKAFVRDESAGTHG